MKFSVYHPVLFILAGILVATVLALSVFFLIKAARRSGQNGMDQAKIRKTIKPAAVFTVGIMVPVSVVFTIVAARILYKRGLLS